MKEKDYPVLFADKSGCCGCGVCGVVCKADAIKMQADENGFAYPVIDRDKCICCYMCMNVCPMK